MRLYSNKKEGRGKKNRHLKKEIKKSLLKSCQHTLLSLAVQYEIKYVLQFGRDSNMERNPICLLRAFTNFPIHPLPSYLSPPPPPLPSLSRTQLPVSPPKCIIGVSPSPLKGSEKKRALLLCCKMMPHLLLQPSPLKNRKKEKHPPAH